MYRFLIKTRDLVFQGSLNFSKKQKTELNTEKVI